jgi:prepilin-type processing-associated H-X9-DG protein
LRKTFAGVGAVAILLVLAGVYVWTGRRGPNPYPPGIRHEPGVPATREGLSPSKAVVEQTDESQRQPAGPRPERHPLWASEEQTVLAESVPDVASTAGAKLSEVIRAVARSGRGAESHPGGVNVALADGAVKFMTNNINAGDPTRVEVTSGLSPFGVWGSLGSKDGGEPTRFE